MKLPDVSARDRGLGEAISGARHSGSSRKNRHITHLSHARYQRSHGRDSPVGMDHFCGSQTPV
ncbi:MAG TPA: hypothetical protein VE890_08160 [Thermoguttaceae bacterium]|nr:hypothetical protein [Thermoguttaceae bacterium]